MMVKKVAILGAGNGGMTAAADLKEQGFEISLYELPQFGNNLKVMQEKGGKYTRLMFNSAAHSFTFLQRWYAALSRTTYSHSSGLFCLTFFKPSQTLSEFR